MPASCRSGRSPARGDGLVIISPNDPEAMVQYAQECRALGIRYIWDPGQQCARMDGDAARRGHQRRLHGHRQRLRVRADPPEDGLSEADIERQVRCSSSHTARRLHRAVERARVDVPAVAPARIEDPTGVGDAFRGGFMKGLATGAPYEVCARLGSVAATYALEYLGGTSHSYTVDGVRGPLRKALRAARRVLRRAKRADAYSRRGPRLGGGDDAAVFRLHQEPLGLQQPYLCVVELG